MKNIIASLALALAATSAFSQTISGPSTVCPGVNQTYTVDQSAERIIWSITGGTFVGSTFHTTTVTANFTSTGTISVALSEHNEEPTGGPWFDLGSDTQNVTVLAIGTISSPAGPVCPGNITISKSGGNVTSSIQWQKSSNGTSGWTSFSTSTGSSVTYNLTAKTWFRRVYTGCTANLVSNVISVDVKPQPTAATIAGAQTIFTGATAGNLTITSAPLADGNYYAHWQQRPPGVSTWGDASGTYYGLAMTTYSPGAVSQTTVYRMVAEWGCNTGIKSTSNSVTITTQALPAISIQGTAPPVLALGSSITLMSVNSHYSYQWSKNDIDIGGATASTLVVSEPGTYKLRARASSTSSFVTTAGIVIYPLGSEPDNSFNKVVTTTVRKAGVHASADLYDLELSEYSQNIQYTDGLMRPVQTILIGQSPLSKDIIVPYAYDSTTSRSYLPFVATSRTGSYDSKALTNGGYTGSNQYLFYQSPTTKIDTSRYPYASTTMESSPLRRPLEIGAPGTGWQPGQNTIRPQFQTNPGSTVKIWTPSGPSGYYAANTLNVSQVKDENGNLTYTFVNKAGQQLLKRVQVEVSGYLETYNVYDALGNLVIQVPPKASALINSGATWTTAFRDQHCFVYVYDSRNRLIEKKVPDADWAYYAYDPLDRLVLTQDANLKPQNKWLFVKYDFAGRVVMTGLYTNTTYTARADIQLHVLDDLYSNANDPYFEERGSTMHGYTNQSFPQSNAPSGSIEPLTVNYYDNYDFDNNGAADYNYTSQGLSGESSQGSSAGKITGTKKLILNSSNWLYTYQFYDAFGRPIQTRSNNHRSATPDNISTLVYDFVGNVLTTKKSHNGGASNQFSVVNKMEYDAQNRLVKVYQNINAQGSDQLLAQYKYNEVGQRVEKNLHAINPTQFLQSVDYRYNIRGWLKSINNASLSNSGGNDDTNDYFGMELLYGESDTELGNTASYNGNISAIKWKGVGATGAENMQSYKFSYDKSDRLTTSAYQKYDGSSNWDREVGMLNETQTFDQNGNILTLQRKAIARTISETSGVLSSVASANLLDDLTYTYATDKTNQITTVDDGGIAGEGFKDNGSAAGEYSYTSTGSLSADDNKGIDSIAYNFLNKPEFIALTGSPAKTITYTYDAGGNKLRTVTYDGTTTITTDYIDGFIYVNDTLSFMGTPEGRAVYSPADDSFEYQYNITDHQGNTRVIFSSKSPDPDEYTATFEDDTETDEENIFQNYPTGGSRSSVELFDHTDINGSTYSHSQLLNGANNSQVGLSKALKVYPGDQLHAKVYAKYWNVSSSPANITGFAAALTSAFGLSSGVTGEALKAFNALNDYGGLVAAATEEDEEGSPPRAYLTILLFDQDLNFVDAAFDRISTDGEQPDSPTKSAFDSLSIDMPITEAGYAYIYISNENFTQVDVYFDDMKITHSKNHVIQYNEYYPFGLQNQNSWTRENVKGNNFLYNQGSELNELTGLYDTYFRGYDAAIGRFHQVDPMAVMSVNLSTYHYSSNSPAMRNDPSGAMDLAFYTEIGAHTAGTGEYYAPMMDGTGGGATPGGGGYETSVFDIIKTLMDSEFGGKWTPGGGYSRYGSGIDALYAGVQIMNKYRMWDRGGGFARNVDDVFERYYTKIGVTVMNDVVVQSTRIQTQGNGPQQDGFINIDKFLPMDFRGGLPPDYIGVFIAASYVSMNNRFSGYNWIYNVTTNHGSVIETDPNNFLNQGPFYYGEDYRDADRFGKNNLYSATEFPTMNFMADLTLYGKEGANYTEIGTVRYGFSFNNGILTVINPTITYRGQ